VQAIILAAGMGRRLGKLTQSDTKCMVEVNGQKLIDRTLDSCVLAKVSRIIIVVGYESERVINHVGHNYKGIPIHYVNNANYSSTNNIVSLSMCIDFLVDDDSLLFESDLIFSEDIVLQLVDSKIPNLAIVSPFQNWMDGTVVSLDSDRRIVRFSGKMQFDYDSFDTYYKTVNIYKFSKEFSIGKYVPFLKAYLLAFGNNEYYEEVLKLIVNMDNHGLSALVVDAKDWYEIDTMEDHQIASINFGNHLKRVEDLSSRHGGYWRFPEILDYCYLVNPFFPPKRMVNELQFDFEVLMSSYPSTLKIQNQLVASFYGLEETSVLVGNGASELIVALGHVFKGIRVGVFLPAFEEYRQRFSGSELVEIHGVMDSHGRLEQILNNIDSFDVFVLVNPDNPTGIFLTRYEINELLRVFQLKNKKLILDESFIDFSADGMAATYLSSDYLEEFPNLIVLKSISKSFGVPGLRLGVMASSDNSIISRVKERLPVWGINSFAESFLQKIGKYKKDYISSLREFREEKFRFENKLAKFSELTIYPSEANFIMINLDLSINTHSLTNELMKYNVLIKSLDGKDGIEPGKIRVAVRTPEENDTFVHAFKEALESFKNGV
jgi:histidinol-phosphate/aromatic aminotransferase/cobyric acid decarboxylase-like protein/choline kinase